MLSCRYQIFPLKQRLSGGEVVNQKLNPSCDYLILLLLLVGFNSASGMKSQRADPVYTETSEEKLSINCIQIV